VAHFCGYRQYRRRHYNFISYFSKACVIILTYVALNALLRWMAVLSVAAPLVEFVPVFVPVSMILPEWEDLPTVETPISLSDLGLDVGAFGWSSKVPCCSSRVRKEEIRK
jgi:hypothetical protein